MRTSHHQYAAAHEWAGLIAGANAGAGERRGRRGMRERTQKAQKIRKSRKKGMPKWLVLRGKPWRSGRWARASVECGGALRSTRQVTHPALAECIIKIIYATPPLSLSRW